MSMPEITGRDGVRLATYAEGPEGAPALLFIHGWAQQSVCWRPVMDRLKRTHFIDDLNGQVFLSQNRAFRELSANGGPPAEPIGDAARGMI